MNTLAQSSIAPTNPREIQGRSELLHLIKTCGRLKDVEEARRFHADLCHHLHLHKPWFAKDICMNNALISMYAKCGGLREAQDLFDELPVRNVISWTALISGYAQSGFHDEALRFFKQMQNEGIAPNAVTFTCVLKACSAIGSLTTGEEIHAEISKTGLLFLDKGVVLGTALVDMYAKCGMMTKAREVFFNELPIRNVVCWTALVSGYARHGCGNEALKCYMHMRDIDGICPDAITYVCILKACSSIGALEFGERIHHEVRKQGLIGTNVFISTALMDMYAKCGKLDKSQELFDEGILKRNVVSWNVLISGYVQHGLAHQALNCFRNMQDEGHFPNIVTFLCILKACAILGSYETGKEVHGQVLERGLSEKDVVLCTALVDMYAKCGALERAHEVFDLIPLQSVVSWNALMSGYAQLGDAQKVFDVFNKMIEEQGTAMPDSVTFLNLLNVSCHDGLVKEGKRMLSNMEKVYFLTPEVEHYTCMVDLFSRTGHFGEALVLIEKAMISSNHLPMWLALLSACLKWENVEIGRWAFEKSVGIDEKCTSAYACMANIYAASGHICSPGDARFGTKVN